MVVPFRFAELVPTALAAGQVSTAPQQQLAQAADAAQGAANTFSEFYENEAKINRELILAHAQADWTRSMMDRAPDAGPGFAGAIKQEYEAYVAKAMQTAPERGRDDLELAFAKFGIDLETQAMRAEAAARARAKAAAAAATRKAREDTLRMQANSLVTDPGRLAELIEAHPDHAQYFVGIALDARMMTEPEAVLVEMQNNFWDQYISPSEKLSFIRKGTDAAETMRAVEQGELGASMAESLAYVAATGTPPDIETVENTKAAIRMLFPDEQERVIADYDQGVEDAMMGHRVMGATPEELQAEMDGYRAAIAQPGNTEADVKRANAFYQAVAARDQAIADDPAGFVNQVSKVTSLYYDDWAAAEPEAKAAAALRLVAAQNVTYDRLGIPEEQRIVMPKAAATGIVSEFNAMAPDVVVQTLAEFKDQWGPAAPRVAAQLAREGLAPEYAVALRHVDNPGLSSAIASLQGQTVASMKTGLPPAAVNEAEAALIDGLVEFRTVFTAGDATGEAQGIFAAHHSVAERLLLQRIGTGEDPLAAAEWVVSNMFPEEVINTTEMQVLVPVGFHAGRVERGLERAMSNDALRAFVPAPLDLPGLPEFADREVLIESVQDYGVWLNNATGDGAVLHMDVGGYFLPVIGKDGRLYDVKFSDADAGGRFFSRGVVAP